jgi:hypothetical protein
MVMGQEERKNKAKLEKTQISLATSNAEYEAAIKALEETTARWNREWKAAADKFQDLEEERLDFTKSSLWTFANIASTVCVSDDASCEKIRLSLEKMEVEKDIITFIKERGTGQEIPDPPKYINFCRGDVDSQSEASEDESYSVAQFPRSINPAFRSSSPQPSTFESHHDPNSALARNLGHGDPGTPQGRDADMVPQIPQKMVSPPQQETQRPRRDPPRGYQPPRANNLDYDPAEFAPVPHDPYPMDGMTMLCRPTASDLSTAPSTSSARPSSRDSHSETSFSSQEPPPAKQEPQTPAASPDKKVLKKKSGFFQNHSPFRRKSTKEIAPNNRNTWHPSNNQSRPQLAAAKDNHQVIGPERSASPDPIAANASLALNVGQNVFAVETPDRQKQAAVPSTPEDDPIALALAELKGVTTGKNSAGRISADHYHGIATPAPGASPRPRTGTGPGGNNSVVAAAMRGTPPPSYDQQIQVQRLGVPPPAVTSKAMKESSQKFQQQTRSLFSSSDRPGSGGGGGYGSSMSRPGTRGGPGDVPRAASPAPQRSVSPRPGSRASFANSFGSHGGGQRAASPSVYAAGPSSHRGSVTQLGMSPKQGHAQVQPQRGAGAGSDHYFRSSGGAGGGGRSPSINDSMARSVSPSPYSPRDTRPGSSMGGGGGGMDHMAVQLAPAPGEGDPYGGSLRGRHNRSNTASSLSMRGGNPNNNSAHGGGMSLYEGAGPVQAAGAGRTRSKSVAAADSGRFTRDGRPILHFGQYISSLPLLLLCGELCANGAVARALYMYQAAIPEELGFAKGDILAILRHQDDGWWEATVQGGNGMVGLVPSNYLQPC